MFSRILCKTVVTIVAGLLFSGPAAASPQLQIRIPRMNLVGPLNYNTQDYSPLVYFQDSNTLAIAGHRVTPWRLKGWPYGPFRHIDWLRLGDRIYISYGKYTNVYKVIHIYPLVLPTHVRDYTRLSGIVLSACTPPYSATYRYVVRGRLIKVVRG